mgnify:CR=1 FL=1
MKRAIFTVMVVMFFTSCIARSVSTKNKRVTDESILPEKILLAIENCDSLKWMLLDPMTQDSTHQSYTLIGEVLAEEKDSIGERIGALRSTLTYSKSFEATDIKKDCTFLPDIALVLYSSSGELFFSYSFYCDVCRFQLGELREELDGELVRDAILQFSLEIFPKDRYLRKIAGLTR